MATALSRRSAKKCKGLSSDQLEETIRNLRVQLPELTALYEAAEKERRRRLKAQKDREELHRKMNPRNFDGDQP